MNKLTERQKQLTNNLRDTVLTRNRNGVAEVLDQCTKYEAAAISLAVITIYPITSHWLRTTTAGLSVENNHKELNDDLDNHR